MVFLGFIIFIFLCGDVAGFWILGYLIFNSHENANGTSEEKDARYAKEIRLIKILGIWESILIGCTLMLTRWFLKC